MLFDDSLCAIAADGSFLRVISSLGALLRRMKQPDVG